MKINLVETNIPLPLKNNDKEYPSVNLLHICEIYGVEK